MPRANQVPTAAHALSALRALASPHRAKASLRFFKTGSGQYGAGDRFLGLTVPLTRRVAKNFSHLPQPELVKLLRSPWHEARLCALLIAVGQYHCQEQAKREALYKMYLANTAFINNWDLVDSSCEHIVGHWLSGRREKMSTLRSLANSELLWERRIAMVATFHDIKAGRSAEALEIARMLLQDSHDLMHKAVGWMLREVGKRVSPDILRAFLNEHAGQMPRTALRYAIEHFSKSERAKYLAMPREQRRVIARPPRS